MLKPLSRDISFIDLAKPIDSPPQSESQVKLVNSEVFDDVRLEEFCRSMLNPSLTAKYSLLPSHGYGKPCSRKDVELLAEWVQTQEADMVKKGSAKELFEEAQMVYGKCIKELVRQVAVQCMERGVLLDKILRAYMFLFEKVLFAYKKDIAKREFANRSKVTKLHELYLGKLDQLRKKMYEQAEQIRKTKEELETSQHTVDLFITKEANYKERIRIMQQHYEDTKRKLQMYERDPSDNHASSMEGKPAVLQQFYNMAPERAKRPDPFLDKELAEGMDELGDDKNQSLAFARKLFKHQIMKFIKFDRGTSGSAIKVLNSKSTQTKLIHFVISPVQVESSMPLPQAPVFRKRVSLIWKAQSVSESAMVLERLSESLKDIDLILLGNDVEILTEEAQMKHANLKLILERCMDYTGAGILYRDFMTTQMKKIKQELQEKEKTAKMAERKYRVLDQENLRLSEIVEQLEIGLSQLRRELVELKKRDISPEVKIKVVAEGGEEIKAPLSSWTAFKEFQLCKRKILYKRSSNLPSTILVEKFNSEVVKSKATMTVKTLLRVLTAVFMEYKQQSHDSSIIRSQEFSQYCYEWLMAKHGLRRVTEQKFLHILAACQFFKENKRVHLFGRLLQLFEPLYNEDLKFYAVVTDAMTRWGLAPDAIEVEDPLLEQEIAHSVLCEVLKPKFPDLDESKLKYELEPFAHRTGFIHQYDFINLSLRKFRILLSVNKNVVVDLFKAADLNGDGYLELEEFEVLCHHIVKDKGRIQGIGRIFESSADLMLKVDEGDDPMPVISLEKFSALSIEFDLFGVPAQNKFMEVESEADILESFGDLKKNSLKIFLSMRLLLQKTLSEHPTLLQSMSILDSKLSSEGNERSLYMAFKLLEAETKLRYAE